MQLGQAEIDRREDEFRAKRAQERAARIRREDEDMRKEDEAREAMRKKREKLEILANQAAAPRPPGPSPAAVANAAKVLANAPPGSPAAKAAQSVLRIAAAAAVPKVPAAAVRAAQAALARAPPGSPAAIRAQKVLAAAAAAPPDMSWLTEPPPAVFEMDWDEHMRRKRITPDDVVVSQTVNEFKGEEYAKRGDPSCPTCKNAGVKKSWPLVLNPVSVNAIDLPLFEELHRRVDYLIEPAAKKLSIKQSHIDKGRRVVVEATDHHQRVADFGDKHKNQLLIPMWMQEEQQQVQL